MKILRVFPARTSYTPTDPMAIVGPPPLGPWRPAADEVHVSVTFTWHLHQARQLVDAWRAYYPIVRLGGPALDDAPDGFTPGCYVKPGVTFTTRGCNNHCPYCLVHPREGPLREIADFAPGHIVQDNNLLQASHDHQARVYAMLQTQPHAAVFAGGLDPRIVADDPWIADQLQQLRIEQLFLSADTRDAMPPLQAALQRLSFLPRRKLRVYTMLGYLDETIAQATERLEALWRMGAMPFTQLYRPPGAARYYGKQWHRLSRTWCRPAAMQALHTQQEELDL